MKKCLTISVFILFIALISCVDQHKKELENFKENIVITQPLNIDSNSILAELNNEISRGNTLCQKRQEYCSQIGVDAIIKQLEQRRNNFTLAVREKKNIELCMSFDDISSINKCLEKIEDFKKLGVTGSFDAEIINIKNHLINKKIKIRKEEEERLKEEQRMREMVERQNSQNIDFNFDDLASLYEDYQDLRDLGNDVKKVYNLFAGNEEFDKQKYEKEYANVLEELLDEMEEDAKDKANSEWFGCKTKVQNKSRVKEIIIDEITTSIESTYQILLKDKFIGNCENDGKIKNVKVIGRIKGSKRNYSFSKKVEEIDLL